MDDITLGKFSYNNGGDIYLAPSDNMEYGLETSSYVHELFHADLSYTSNIGLLMHLIEIENQLEQNDLQYKIELSKKMSDLYEATRFIQEVYANSMELLWIEEYCGSNIKQYVYEGKTEEYKQNLAVSEHIWKNEEKTIDERKEQINKFCVSVLNIDILSEQFWEILNDNDKRLLEMKDVLKNRMDFIFNRQKIISDSKLLEKSDLINLSKIRFKHIFGKLEEGFSYIERCVNLEKFNMTKSLLENIKIFDFSEIEISKAKRLDLSCNAICLIKDVYINKEGRIEIGLIQHFDENGLYKFIDMKDIEIKKSLENKKYVIMLNNDFSFNKKKTIQQKIGEKVIFVLFKKVKEFKKCLQDISEFEEVYLGNISDESTNNFFTVLYFRTRSCDDVIYMFPTLNIIANNIFEELDMKRIVKYPGKGTAFYNIFSAFNNWAEILKTVKETISFVINNKGNILHNINPSSRLISKIKIDVANNILKIGGENELYFHSIFPTTKTEGQPFWILMEFEDGENKGNIKCDNIGTDKTKLGVNCFDQKNIAERYIRKISKHDSELKKYKVVGLDDIFWKGLKKCLQVQKIGMIWRMRDSGGIYFDNLEEFEATKYKLYKESF